MRNRFAGGTLPGAGDARFFDGSAAILTVNEDAPRKRTKKQGQERLCGASATKSDVAAVKKRPLDCVGRQRKKKVNFGVGDQHTKTKVEGEPNAGVAWWSVHELPLLGESRIGRLINPPPLSTSSVTMCACDRPGGRRLNEDRDVTLFFFYGPFKSTIHGSD